MAVTMKNGVFCDVPHFLDNRLIDGSKSLSLTPGHPLHPARVLVLVSIGSGVNPRATVLLEGLGELKENIQ
jgi:hypothetical protein